MRRRRGAPPPGAGGRAPPAAPRSASDVDWTVEAAQGTRAFRVDRVRAAEAGASLEQITGTQYLAVSGTPVATATGPQPLG